MSGVKEPSSVRLAGTLGVAGLVSGLILVLIFLGTESRIQKNRAEALRRAVFRVVPGAKTIEPYALKDDTLVPFEGAPGVPTEEELVYRGIAEDGTPLGFAIPAEGAGFQDTIKILYGFDPSRRAVIGMAVLESRETPGLGDKIDFDPAFQANFEELKVEPQIELVKKGEKTQPNQVDAITGATISSRAVVTILGQSTKRWMPKLESLSSGEQPTARAKPEAR